MNFFFLIPVLLLPQSALADMALPVLAFQWPFFWLAFLPIVLIEFWIMHKSLPFVPKSQIFKATCWANLISSLLGVPFLWISLFGTYFIVLTFLLLVAGKHAPSFLKNPESVEFFVFLPEMTKTHYLKNAFFTLLWWGIFFAMSYWVEMNVTSKRLETYQISPENLKKAVFKANIYSYALLFFLHIACIVYFWIRF